MTTAPRPLVATLAAFTVAAIPAFATAQSAWPDKPITLVVPYAAGGPTDVGARLIALPMSNSLGKPIIVENTLGAGGTLGTARVARAAPNGYTFLMHHLGMSTAPALYKKLPFDPLKDFEYVGQVMDVPMTLLSRKDFPANNFAELLAYVKVNKERSLSRTQASARSRNCADCS